MLIPILYGSPSDEIFIKKITAELDKLNIPYQKHVGSAHKVPEKVLQVIQEYNNSADQICYITVAGRSNALSGMVAANSLHPVIACPPFENKEDMILNINSSLMMPSETPVMTVIDPKNAVLSAAKILGLGNKDLQNRIKTRIEEVKKKF